MTCLCRYLVASGARKACSRGALSDAEKQSGSGVGARRRPTNADAWAWVGARPMSAAADLLVSRIGFLSVVLYYSGVGILQCTLPTVVVVAWKPTGLGSGRDQRRTGGRFT